VGEALQNAIDLAAKEGKTTVNFPRRARTHEYPSSSWLTGVHGSVEADRSGCPTSIIRN